ncbi:MAG: CoA activase [Candidatus Zixiibacteriota bacterium]|nr:MAG: CoA activase [candidate division Zixibacteria bacterium]
MRLGIDIGSVSLSAAILDSNSKIIDTVYKRHRGDPVGCSIEELSKLNDLYGDIGYWGFTGNGAMQVSRSLKANYVNEFSSISAAAGKLLPGVKTIFEMGGQQAKYIRLSPAENEDMPTLDDFAASGLCAAGTGSFLDQQATRLGVNIESEFGELAMESGNPPHIAGRCSVFAKSDMIHHQQRGVPTKDIIAGLCYAVARNFKGTIVKTKKIQTPVAFLGGVGLNPGVVKAFRDVFGFDHGEIIVPEWCVFGGAVGAALLATEFKMETAVLIKSLERLKTEFESNIPRASIMSYDKGSTRHYAQTKREMKTRSDIKSGYLGVDVGSLSTNVVLTDGAGRIIARRYLMTAGKPIEAVQRGLSEIESEISKDFEVLSAASTGSGRYLIGELIGADIIRNEITAQATGALSFVPDVDTIFEIGGQDSKFISLENGVVVDFEMNRACAAGTGSFLQEQAERLGIDIKEDFANLALKADRPVACGERCTVFMESDLVRFEQGGANQSEIAAGLAYGVVHNYLNKVVGKKRIGERILFQGGVAWNRAVVAAFETVLGKKIMVPPHHDITGAVGAALLAKNANIEKSGFKGFGISRRKIKQESFLCEDCANICNVTKIDDQGRELYYGSRCEKYDLKRREKSKQVNPVTIRNRKFFAAPGRKSKRRELKIGLLRALSNWEFLYLWRRFFLELGCRVYISRQSAGEIIKKGVESAGSETCFPVKVAHGHLIDMLKRELDFIFLPSIITGADPAPQGVKNYYCPYIQAFPYMAKSTLKERLNGTRLSTPVILFDEGESSVIDSLYGSLKEFGFSKWELKSAYEFSLKQHEIFKANLILDGKRYQKDISERNPGILLIGRHYNSLDPGVSMRLAQKLTDLGTTVIPMEMIELPDDDYHFIYWQSGRRILKAARFARETPGLYPVYVSNFSCGPDSFIIHHFKKVMGEKPHMILELDEHSADAGIITRCEAFLDSLPKKEKTYGDFIPLAGSDGHKRKLLIPRMSDHAESFAAALRACGVDAEVLPETDNRSLELGRRLTGGRECYPAVLTAGDLARELEKPDVDPDKVAFFMPTAGGPCRFGQYHHLHKQLMENLGYEKVPIYSPSSDNSYSDWPGTSRKFRRLAWKGFLASDYLRKFLYKSRPYEINMGDAAAIYSYYLNRTIENLEQGGENLAEILRDALFDFKNIIDENIPKKPMVGIVGEIYIRNNRFSNNRLADKLESLGVEVDITSFTEWISFTTEMYRRDSIRTRSSKELLNALIKSFYQKKDEKRVLKFIHNGLNVEIDSPIKDVLPYVDPYLPISVGGEAMPAMAKAIELIKTGYSGIVNTMPFTCMPGNIIVAISSEIAEDLDGIPWLNMAYDGSDGDHDLVKLGAFVESVKSRAAENDG